MTKNDFTSVTELPGGGATAEQLSMAVTRYSFAANLAKGKSILELASGAGIGLGILAEKANKVVGSDIDPGQVKMGQNYYNERFELVESSAENTPFENQSFDVVIILEAIYYIENLSTFISEVKRLLKPGGKLMVSYPNNEWPNFNPSPFTNKYFTINEMAIFLESNNFSTETFIGFKHSTDTIKAQIIDLIRSVAVKLHLIPKSFALKDIFKRIFLGKLKPLPQELNLNDGEIYDMQPFKNNKDYKTFRVVYTIGTLK